jgi:hypothetical protein
MMRTEQGDLQKCWHTGEKKRVLVLKIGEVQKALTHLDLSKQYDED